MVLSSSTLTSEVSCESTQLSVSHSALISLGIPVVPVCSRQVRLGLRADERARSYPPPFNHSSLPPLGLERGSQRPAQRMKIYEILHDRARFHSLRSGKRVYFRSPSLIELTRLTPGTAAHHNSP